MLENERRRLTAREAWLMQLTPEQRGQYELDLPDEAPRLRELAARKRRFTRVEDAPVDEPHTAAEALQRAIERRD